MPLQTLNNVTLTIDGMSVKVERVDIEFHHTNYCSNDIERASWYPGSSHTVEECECSPKAIVSGFLEQTKQVKEGKDMTLKTVPPNLAKVLNEHQKAFYKLGWVDSSLNLTGDGERAVLDLLAAKYEKELGEAASLKIAECEAQCKKESTN